MVFDKGFRLKDSIYDVLKWVCLIALPALSTFYSVLASIWDLPYATQIPKTITAVALFIGALIGVSHWTIKKASNSEPTSEPITEESEPKEEAANEES